MSPPCDRKPRPCHRTKEASSPARLARCSPATPLVALLFAATGDAARLDELSPEELQERTERALTTGSPDSTQMLQRSRARR